MEIDRSKIFKIQNGTQRSDKESLCHSCTSSHVRRGADNQMDVLCGVHWHLVFPVTYKVTECNKYYKAGSPAVVDMEKIAVDVGVGKPSPVGTTGFVNAHSQRQKSRVGFEK
jgi:hypothetical protein